MPGQQAPGQARNGWSGAMAYVELHCHTNYSLLDGASLADDLADRAAELAMPALAVADHDGLYGAVRFVKAVKARGVKPIVGAELTLESGHHVVLLARSLAGYSNLCRLVSHSQLTHSKGKARLAFDVLAAHSADLIALSGCRDGEVPSLLLAGRDREARAAAERYRDVFGDAFWIELQHHRRSDDPWLCATLARLARQARLGVVATNDVHYATPAAKPLQDVLVCIRTHTTLDQAHALRKPNAEYFLKSESEMADLFRGFPGAVEASAEIAAECDVKLDFGAYRFPPFDLPPDESAFSYLFQLCHQGARERYRPFSPAALRQLTHELGVIERLGLSEYFLIVWDIVRFARERGILAQGRGSAANSIVAYCLGITNVDPLKLDLLFERFLSEERAGTPDIDVDFANSRREEVIQYVYEKYGAEHAAMVCTVNTFQARSAVRDVGKALGIPLGLLGRATKSLEHRGARDLSAEAFEGLDLEGTVHAARWQQLFDLCHQIDGFPRHLGIHVGGMIVTARPLVELMPLERATMPGRVVCQFDKDDVEDLGLVKIDLLGLGMLSAVQDCLDLIREHRGTEIDLATLPLDDPKVYDMLCRADTVGVFQVESRAQMTTLPRLQPRTFYDIITEIAIIRPGPIQGQMVHPFINRRQGKEPITFLHPSLEPVLAKTMGIVLFQEQVIKVGMVAGGFSPGEADLLRRAMGGHRSRDKMLALHDRFVQGALARGIDEPTAEAIFHQLEGFAAYGFPESHAAAFAKIVYDSAYLKLYYPAEFYCALLNNWPMGFYQPSVVAGDARRHGVLIRPIHADRSRAKCTVEGQSTIRLGYRYVRGIGEAVHDQLDAAAAEGPYPSLEDFCRRTRLDRATVANLIAVGGFDHLGIPRRQLLWQLPAAIQAGRAGELPALAAPTHEADLPTLTPIEEARSDYYVLGLSPAYHVMDFYRPRLDADDVLRVVDLEEIPHGRWVKVAGLVICRQAPPTAHGHVFLTVEDETGLLSVTIRPNVYQAYRRIVRHELVLLMEGTLQRQEGTLSILARRFQPLALDLALPAAREFR